MSDLVERLRAPLGVMQCEVSSGAAPKNRLERRWLVALEAAARIEQLEAALRSVSVEFDDTYSPASREGRLGRLARAALEDRT